MPLETSYVAATYFILILAFSCLIYCCLHSPPPAPLCSDLGTEIFPLVELRHFQAFAPGIENPY